jgi:hypothetical protein
MVTYLRRSEAQTPMFWGYIDWSEETPALRELSTIVAFDKARAVVGLI